MNNVLVCVPLLAKNKSSIIEDMTYLQTKDYDLIELRLDYYENIECKESVIQLLKEIKPLISKPLLITLRSLNEGGYKHIDNEYYYSLLKDIISLNLTDMIDIELLKDKINNFELIEHAHNNHIKVVMSYHNFNKTDEIDVLKQYMDTMEVMGADIAKIAVMPRCKEDVVNLINLSMQLSSYMSIGIVVIAMGELGKITRVIGDMIGSYMTFASLSCAVAPGQLSIDEINMYRRIK